MKKNWIVRSAIIVFAVLMLTGGIFSTTLAKYTWSSGTNIGESARVAKFSFNLGGVENAQTTPATLSTTINIFSKNYVASTINTGADAYVSGQTVFTNGADDVIAPGTTGTIPLSVVNTGEVAIQVGAINITETNTSSIPIKYSTDDGATWKAANEVSIPSATIYKGGTNTVNLKWQWAFDGANATDTNLGVAGTAEYDVDIAITVDQVD